MLDINASLLGIALLITILLFILNKIFFKPVGKVLDERETKIKTDTTEIDTKTKEIEELTLGIERRIKETQRESRKIREELIKKGEEVREIRLQDAREKAKDISNTRLKQLEDEISLAEKQLELQITSFSHKLKEIFVTP